MTNVDRRGVLSGIAASAAVATLGSNPAKAAEGRSFPQGFLWGAATAGHQVEGNNTASEMWLLENVKPTLFAEPSGDADNSFELWPTDLDLVRDIGLNAYRFSLEWSRIEPVPGSFSMAMLDHYKAMIDGCHARGITPVVTFNHYTTPLWFADLGGWMQANAPDLFARFCDRAARHLAAGIGYATTLNEPNSANMFEGVFPSQMMIAQRAMNVAAARASGSATFRNPLFPEPAEAALVQARLIAAHKAGRAAIKAVRSNLPVGVSLAIQDDQAVGSNSLRDAKRKQFYGDWLAAVKGDDFLGVQNYARVQWSDKGMLPAPPGVKLNAYGGEVFPPSLANAVSYAHAATGVPILVTEHGVGTDDDTVRADLIQAALAELQRAIADGVPVKGYLHWSLLDNFEWIFGFSKKFGLCSVDHTTFRRTPKPSAGVLGAIARNNRL